MIPNYPYFGLPNYMRSVNPKFYANSNQVYNNSNTHKIRTNFNAPKNSVCANTSSTSDSKVEFSRSNNSSDASSPLFSIFGITLYFDDVLLLCIIFFLYNENVNDPYLFFSLILLLLN